MPSARAAAASNTDLGTHQFDGAVLTLLARNASGDYVHPCDPGGERQRALAVQFAVNIVLYATCTDYKADPAHVETLLRSRRWR